MDQIGKHAAPIGKTPAILLANPKYGKNVGMVLRLASCYGLSQVWYTGTRIEYERGKKGKVRLPREERMKGYREVELIGYDYPFDQFKDVTPVAVEVKQNSERLHDFEHPENPLYVFGPEDGSIDPVLLRHCHRFVIIPTRHCLNLATAVATILWDRQYKDFLLGGQSVFTPGEFEQRGVYHDPTM